MLEHVERQVVRVVLDAADHVIAQVAVLQLAAVEDHVLVQRLADAERHVAFRLQLGLDRVDGPSGIDAPWYRNTVMCPVSKSTSTSAAPDAWCQWTLPMPRPVSGSRPPFV